MWLSRVPGLTPRSLAIEVIECPGLGSNVAGGADDVGVDHGGPFRWGPAVATAGASFPMAEAVP